MKEISWKSCIKLGIVALVVFLCIRYWGGIESFISVLLNALAAILAGFVIAYVINIPMRFFERKLPGPTGDGTRNRILSLILAIACIVIVLLFVILLVIPAFVNAVLTLSAELPSAIKALEDNAFIASIVPADILEKLKNINWSDVVGSVVTWLQSGVTSALPEIFSIIGVVAAWGMGILLSFWYLSEKDRLSAQCHRMVRNYLSPRIDEKLVRALALIDDCFRRFIVAQCLEALIFGVLVACVAFLFGLPYSTMLGALVGVMSLIPMVGAIIGAIIGAFIILATSWQKAVLFLVVFIVVSFVEANVVYKRVVGKRVGLTGMWPLIGVTLGVSLFGIAGAFVGVPVTSAIFRMVHANLEKRESMPEDTPTPLDKLQETLSD